MAEGADSFPERVFACAQACKEALLALDMRARLGALTRADSVAQLCQPSGEALSRGQVVVAGKGSRGEGANESNIVRVAEDMEG